jgi:hypothetical protein
MADKYSSTLLAQEASPTEIQKADLDLLKKINEVSKSIPTSTELNGGPVPMISGQIGTTGSASLTVGTKVPFDTFWVNNGGITYDATNRRFYVGATGEYRITFNPFFITAVASCRVLVGINNDAPTQANHFGSAYRESATYDTGCIDSLVTLNKGDYIVFYIQQGQLYNAVGDQFNQFTIQYIPSKTLSSDNVASGTYAPITNGGDYSLPLPTIVGKDQVYRQAFFRYNTTDNVATQWIHMKTNYNKTGTCMFMFHFLGYSYGESKAIDASLGLYVYQPSPAAPISVGTYGSHTCGCYYAADGYLVITLSVTNCYYLGFIIDQIGAGPQGLTPITITASTHTGSATGAY